MTVSAVRTDHHNFPRSLSAWVAQLVDDYPGFDEYDLSEMIEEKTGVPVGREDFETVRALYLRSKLQAWFPDTDDQE